MNDCATADRLCFLTRRSEHTKIVKQLLFVYSAL